MTYVVTMPSGLLESRLSGRVKIISIAKIQCMFSYKEFILRSMLSAIWKIWNQRRRFVFRRKIYWNSNNRFAYLSFYAHLMKLKKQSFADFLQNSKKTSVPESLFQKSCRAEAATSLKERLWDKCFPINFEKFLRTPFFIKTYGGCFWNCIW